MSKKIMDQIVERVVSHPIRFVILFFAFSFSAGIIVSKLPSIISHIVEGCGLALMFAIAIKARKESKEEIQEFQNMDKESYEKKWKQYVDLVNGMLDEEKYGRNKLNMDWIQTFDQCIYVVANNWYLLRRAFNDFDIAACLIYSLTCNNNTDESILFAFDCAKKVITEPKEYTLELGYVCKVELKVRETHQKVNICIPDKTITTQAIASSIRGYLMQKTERGIMQLSDFLHILYLKCK